MSGQCTGTNAKGEPCGSAGWKGLATCHSHSTEEQRAQVKAIAKQEADQSVDDDGRVPVDVSNDLVSVRWLTKEVGSKGTPLAGIFYRGGAMVHTPMEGEAGYEPLPGVQGSNTASGEAFTDGLMQMRVVNRDRLLAYVTDKYSTYMRTDRGKKLALIGGTAVGVVVSNPDSAPNLRHLRAVSHTPVVRTDGTILWSPGYDSATGYLFHPDAGLVVPEVPTVPTVAQVREARAIIMKLVADFPWNSPDDKANYLAMMMTPLLRLMCPPPYKWGHLGAHQAGSGKSLLAYILRTLHGGVMRGPLPASSEEVRKQITGILTTTTAPVVQWDNVVKVGGPDVDALVTSSVWDDRVLGQTLMTSAPNDRLWVSTGNNTSFYGDMRRRVLRSHIDPNQERPEDRPPETFGIPNLKGYVRDNRGEILAALLTLVRHWVVEGRQVTVAKADDFGVWIATCRGVLASAGIDGTVDHLDTQLTSEDTDDGWGMFLRSIYKEFGFGVFTSSRLADAINTGAIDTAPDGMKTESNRSIGHWLGNRAGRWAEGFKVVKVKKEDGQEALWKVVSRELDEIS